MKFKKGDRVDFISDSSTNAKYFRYGLTNLKIYDVEGGGYHVWDGCPSGNTLYWAREDELRLSCKFQVGDIVKYNGKKSVDYTHTNKDAVCKVLSIYSGTDDIRVEIVSHKTKSHSRGGKWSVQSKYFDLVKPTKQKFKVGDLVTGTQPAHYTSRYQLTSNQALMEVIKVNKYDMDIKILFHKERVYKKDIGSKHSVELDYFKKVPGVKKLKDSVNLKRKKIVIEIEKDPKLKKCFDNVKKEVNGWSTIQILNWFEEGTKVLSKLY